MSEWISVKDRLPESAYNTWSEDVIALTEGGDVFKLANIGGYWQRTSAFAMSDSGEVTHWMPLPEPPDA